MSRVRRFKAPIPPALRRRPARRVRKPKFLHNKPVFGKRLPPRATRYRAHLVTTRRDPSRHSSDEVWGLVEKMMQGDADAALVLNDVIEEGVSGGTTVFTKIRSKDTTQFKRPVPGKIVENQFAAITPGRSIVLFGITGTPYRGFKGYTRRFAIGDVAEYDSFNKSYLGKVVGITTKRITIEPGYSEKKRSLDLYQFNWRNNKLDVAETVRRNQEWTD